MPALFNPADLDRFRESAPIQSQFSDDSIGVWVGGRVYLDEFNDVVFVRCGDRRDQNGIERPLRFIGDGLKNVKGFGDRLEVAAGLPEVRLTNAADR